jgi:hypothetical protein
MVGVQPLHAKRALNMVSTSSHDSVSPMLASKTPSFSEFCRPPGSAESGACGMAAASTLSNMVPLECAAQQQLRAITTRRIELQQPGREAARAASERRKQKWFTLVLNLRYKTGCK